MLNENVVHTNITFHFRGGKYLNTQPGADSVKIVHKDEDCNGGNVVLSATDLDCDPRTCLSGSEALVTFVFSEPGSFAICYAVDQSGIFLRARFQDSEFFTVRAPPLSISSFASTSFGPGEIIDADVVIVFAGSSSEAELRGLDVSAGGDTIKLVSISETCEVNAAEGIASASQVNPFTDLPDSYTLNVRFSNPGTYVPCYRLARDSKWYR